MADFTCMRENVAFAQAQEIIEIITTPLRQGFKRALNPLMYSRNCCVTYYAKLRSPMEFHPIADGDNDVGLKYSTL